MVGSFVIFPVRGAASELFSLHKNIYSAVFINNSHTLKSFKGTLSSAFIHYPCVDLKIINYAIHVIMYMYVRPFYFPSPLYVRPFMEISSRL